MWGIRQPDGELKSELPVCKSECRFPPENSRNVIRTCGQIASRSRKESCGSEEIAIDGGLIPGVLCLAAY